MENTDQPKQSPTRQAQGWAVILLILGGLYVLYRADVTESPSLLLAILLCLLLFWAWAYWKAARDPVWAARLAAVRAKQQARFAGRFSGKLFWIGLALAALALLHALKIA